MVLYVTFSTEPVKIEGSQGTGALVSRNGAEPLGFLNDQMAVY